MALRQGGCLGVRTSVAVELPWREERGRGGAEGEASARRLRLEVVQMPVVPRPPRPPFLASTGGRPVHWRVPLRPPV